MAQESTLARGSFPFFRDAVDGDNGSNGTGGAVIVCPPLVLTSDFDGWVQGGKYVSPIGTVGDIRGVVTGISVADDFTATDFDYGIDNTEHIVGITKIRQTKYYTESMINGGGDVTLEVFDTNRKGSSALGTYYIPKITSGTLPLQASIRYEENGTTKETDVIPFTFMFSVESSAYWNREESSRREFKRTLGAITQTENGQTILKKSVFKQTAQSIGEWVEKDNLEKAGLHIELDEESDEGRVRVVADKFSVATPDNAPGDSKMNFDKDGLVLENADGRTAVSNGLVSLIAKDGNGVLSHAGIHMGFDNGIPYLYGTNENGNVMWRIGTDGFSPYNNEFEVELVKNSDNEDLSSLLYNCVVVPESQGGNVVRDVYRIRKKYDIYIKVTNSSTIPMIFDSTTIKCRFAALMGAADGASVGISRAGTELFDGNGDVDLGPMNGTSLLLQSGESGYLVFEYDNISTFLFGPPLVSGTRYLTVDIVAKKDNGRFNSVAQFTLPCELDDGLGAYNNEFEVELVKNSDNEDLSSLLYNCVVVPESQGGNVVRDVYRIRKKYDIYIKVTNSSTIPMIFDSTTIKCRFAALMGAADGAEVGISRAGTELFDGNGDVDLGPMNGTSLRLQSGESGYLVFEYDNISTFLFGPPLVSGTRYLTVDIVAKKDNGWFNSVAQFTLPCELDDGLGV